MACTTLRTRKDGTRFYEIRVHVQKGKSYKTRWDVPEGWSQKAIERALAKEAAEYERKCKAGEVLTRLEQAEKAAKEEEEASKLLTLEQYANKVFMPTKMVTVSENTRYSYQTNIDKHITPALGSMKLVDITPAMITRLLVTFQASHKIDSCIKLYNILNGIFDMAFMDDSIQVNPMQKVRRPKPKKDETKKTEEEKAYSPEEAKYILQCLKNEPLKWQTFVTLSIDTGARCGEVCGLRWSDIDWDTGTVHLQNNLQYTPAKGIYETTLKGKKSHVVDIGPETLHLLRRLQTEQARTCISRYVFSQEGESAPMHPDTPGRYYTNFGKRYGVADFHPHKLRHTSASLAILNGADVVSVSRRLGHADPSITLRMYAHATDESIRRAGNAVREALRA